MVLDEATILACSQSNSFQRGKKYFSEGRVKNLTFDGMDCSANVIGTERYSVTLNLSTLEGNCDCYVFDGSTWCKHIVAVGLASSQINPDDQDGYTIKQIKSGTSGTAYSLEGMIKQADIGTLRAALLLVADHFPESYDLINAMFSPETFGTELAIVNAAKNYLKPVRSAKNWQRLSEAELSVLEQLETLAQVVPGTETSVKGLLAAAQYIYKQLGSIDDSDGTLQDACYALCHRAIEIVNENHDFEAVLNKAMAIKCELPLESYVLEVGDTFITNRLLSRLDKHILKRDEGLVNIDQDQGNCILQPNPV